MSVALQVSGVRKSYGATVAVDGVDLSVAEGEIFGILGPNGSGKTTTVECAQGLRRPDAGEVRVFGVDPQTHPDRMAALVGAQLQDSALPDRIRVGEALHLFASLADRSGGRRSSRSDGSDLLAQWGLAAKRRATYGSLSGGQRQRLLVALALVARPRLVFLDEMTTGLDPAARREAWQVIEQVRRDGATVVLVTHFMDEAQRLCDRLAVMLDGRVVARGSPAELVARYGGGARVRCHVPESVAVAGWRDLPGVTGVTRHAGEVEVRGSGGFLTALGHALTVAGLGGTELLVEQPGLEDAYVNLLGTGGEPR